MPGWTFQDDDEAAAGAFSQVTYKSADEALRAILRDVQARIATNNLFGSGADRLKVIRTVTEEIISAYNLNAASLRKAPLTVSVDQAVRWIADEIIGWGPLSELMKDPTIEDLIVLRPDQVVAFRAGAFGWQKTDTVFDDWEHIRLLVNNKIDHRGMGKAISEANPRVDAQLEDGSRLHAIMSPLTVAPGPVVTIRRFRPVASELSDLVRLGHMTQSAATFIAALMKAKMSFAVIGGTGSGKTTFVNAALAECLPEERIVTCEDTPELQVRAPFWTQLATRLPTRVNSDDGVDMRQLVKENLRMRPDRIIIGEARGPEMSAILQAGNTGHRGIVFTVHSNNPQDAVSRMETLAYMDADLHNVPLTNLRSMIAIALDYIIHVSSLRVKGEQTRRLMGIAELTGMAGPQIAQEAIFKFDAQRGLAVFNSYPHPDNLAKIADALPAFDFERDVVRQQGF